MKGGGAKSPEVRVSAALRKQYASLVVEMAEARRDEAAGWDRYWEAVGEILGRQLFRLGGAQTAPEWLAEHVDEKYRTALRNIRVAQYASPAEEARWGTTKLDAALGFIDAKIGGPAEGRLPVAFDALRVPVERDGKAKRLGLDDVTTDEVLAATKQLVAEEGEPRARSSPVEQAFADGLRAIRALRAIRVRVIDGHLSLGRIPLPHLEAALRALLAIDWRAATPVARESAKRTSAKPRVQPKPKPKPKPRPKSKTKPQPKPRTRSASATSPRR